MVIKYMRLKFMVHSIIIILIDEHKVSTLGLSQHIKLIKELSLHNDTIMEEFHNVVIIMVNMFMEFKLCIIEEFTLMVRQRILMVKVGGFELGLKKF